MRWREPLTLRVRILSPVAIGTGERCNALGFIAAGGRVLVVDERRFIAALGRRGQQRFLEWMEPTAVALARVREQQEKVRNEEQRRALARQRRELESQLSLARFFEYVRESQPATWLQREGAVRYEVVAVSVPNRYEGFSLCLKTPDHRPYIPGSEIKGALRTAILNALLSRNALLLANLQEQISGLRGSPKQLYEQLHQIWQNTERDLLRSGKSDAHYDLFRGIAVSDSEPLPTNTLRIYAAKRLGMSKDVTVFTEAIAPGSVTKVTLSAAHPNRWLEALGLTNQASWLNRRNLAQALYEHAEAVLDFIDERFPDLRLQVQRLREQNKPHTPLVHLGWGQGFLSVTMTDPLRRQHPRAYEALRQAMAQAIPKKYGRTQPNNFPKTLWVALDGRGNPVDLFGWLQLVPQ